MLFQCDGSNHDTSRHDSPQNLILSRFFLIGPADLLFDLAPHKRKRFSSIDRPESPPDASLPHSPSSNLI